MSCLQDLTFLSINLTTWSVLMLYFENRGFGVVMSWSGRYFACDCRVGSDQVRDNGAMDICAVVLYCESLVL